MRLAGGRLLSAGGDGPGLKAQSCSGPGGSRRTGRAGPRAPGPTLSPEGQQKRGPLRATSPSVHRGRVSAAPEAAR